MFSNNILVIFLYVSCHNKAGLSSAIHRETIEKESLFGIANQGTFLNEAIQCLSALSVNLPIIWVHRIR